jgi:hypothetical protein
MDIVNQSRRVMRKRASRAKMHLRLVRVGGYVFRVVTPRPAARFAFSTNFFHETWHIVTSQRGASALARLLWGLSYERHPGTVLLIHGDHLLPTPFEAERSDPILLVPAVLTRLNTAKLRTLKGRLNRLGSPTKTIRWHSFGLDVALQDRSERGNTHRRSEAEGEELSRKRSRCIWKQERMVRIGGFVCYSAPPPVLRQQALRIHALRVRKGFSDMDYHFLTRESSKGSWCGDGEVQIFADYVDRVSAAIEARRELLAKPNEVVLSETVQEEISRRRDEIKVRRSRQRQLQSSRGAPKRA